MPFFRFSCQLCTRVFSRHFVSRPWRMFSLSRISLLFSDCFPELCVSSIMKMKSDMYIVYARAQAAIL